VGSIAADDLIAGVAEVRSQGSYRELRSYTPAPDVGVNEYCLLIKPELTVSEDTLRRSWGLIAGEMRMHEHQVAGVVALDSGYLQRYGLMERHYGIINRASTQGVEAFGPEAVTALEKLLREYGNRSPQILGGHQFLNEYGFFSSHALAVFYDNLKPIRLAGGTYAVKASVDGSPVLLVNGFHPYQLEHFYSANSVVIAMAVRTLESWREIRRSFCGATNPEAAASDSIRGQLLTRHRAFGISAITSMLNGIHVSAGPVEAVVELSRYLSDNDSNNFLSPQATSFGLSVVHELSLEVLQWAVSNPSVVVEGVESTLFDATEELNAVDGLEMLRKLTQ
jgi:hypothetical protein